MWLEISTTPKTLLNISPFLLWEAFGSEMKAALWSGGWHPKLPPLSPSLSWRLCLSPLLPLMKCRALMRSLLSSFRAPSHLALYILNCFYLILSPILRPNQALSPVILINLTERNRIAASFADLPLLSRLLWQGWGDKLNVHYTLLRKLKNS